MFPTCLILRYIFSVAKQNATDYKKRTNNTTHITYVMCYQLIKSFL